MGDCESRCDGNWQELFFFALVVRHYKVRILPLAV